MNDSGPSISDPRHATRLNASHLQRLIRDRDEQRLKDLLKQDNKPLEHCAALQSALFFACESGFREGVHLLIQKGADVDDCDDFGSTPLHFAVLRNNDGVVEELLSAGANYDVWNREGESLLHWAAFNGHQGVTRELLRRRANLLAVDSSGRYAVHVACKEGHSGVVALLIKEHSPQSSSDVPSSERMRKWRKPEVPQYHVDVEDKNGWTPLHYACTSFAPNYEQVMHLLLTRGADPLKQTPNGKTALHLAFECGRDVLFQVRTVAFEQGEARAEG